MSIKNNEIVFDSTDKRNVRIDRFLYLNESYTVPASQTQTVLCLIEDYYEYVEHRYRHSFQSLYGWICIASSLHTFCNRHQYIRIWFIFSPPSRQGNIFSKLWVCQSEKGKCCLKLPLFNPMQQSVRLCQTSTTIITHWQISLCILTIHWQQTILKLFWQKKDKALAEFFTMFLNNNDVVSSEEFRLAQRASFPK